MARAECPSVCSRPRHGLDLASFKGAEAHGTSDFPNTIGPVSRSTFRYGLALAEAGHNVQIYLLGEAVVLMRKTLANAVTPIGWPPVGETLDKVVSKHVQIYARGAYSSARGVTEVDLSNYGAKFGNPTIFVSLIEWADHVITE